MTEYNPQEIVRKLFDMKELHEAHEIIEQCREKQVQPNATLKRDFVTPKMERIKEKAGQDMDAGYLAYLIEYYFLH